MDKASLQKKIKVEIEVLLKAGNITAAKLMFAKNSGILIGYLSHAQYEILEQDLTEFEGSEGRKHRTELTKLLDTGRFTEADEYFKLHLREIGWPEKIYKEEKTRVQLGQLRMTLRNSEEDEKLKRQKNKSIVLNFLEIGDFIAAEKLYQSSCHTWWDFNDFHERISKKKIENQQNNLRIEALKVIPEKMQSNYLEVDHLYQGKYKTIISNDEYQELKTIFIRNWFNQYFKNFERKKQLPDAQQAIAIGSFNKDIQVIARAGSGKTSTIVNRAIFLIKHCKIPPGKMLLLAFNRSAAFEVQKRLLFSMSRDTEVLYESIFSSKKKSNLAPKDRQKYLEFLYETRVSSISEVAKKVGIEMPPVMTFHALARALANPALDILYDVPDGSPVLTRVVQGIIDDYRRSEEGYQKIRSMMLEHFRADWEKLLENKVDLSKEELVAYKKSLPNESLGGDQVKSYGEKVIANFLFEHDVFYRYEQPHTWSGSRYQPDFTIEKDKSRSGIIIEYFGMMTNPSYLAQANAKKDFWRARNEWTFLDLYPEDITSESEHEAVYRKIKIALTRHEIPFHKLSEDEIWEKVKDRSIDNFDKAIKGFIGRCRKQNLTLSKLKEMAAKHCALTEVESEFVGIAIQIYGDYLAKLTIGSSEDFDGLLINAVQRVATGELNFRRHLVDYSIKDFKYLFIDEFQDFSELFNNLIEQILKVSNAEIFCVGDDWQAINGFAGSNLKYFNEFQRCRNNSELLYISSNYRSKSSIVKLGNHLMKNLGVEASSTHLDSGIADLANLSKFIPSSYEREKFLGNLFLPAVLRLVGGALTQGLDVVLLTRTNTIPYLYPVPEGVLQTLNSHEKFIETVRSYFPGEVRNKIKVSTAHKYKGLERKVVIVLDAIAKSYPLIHPNWIFNRILGDTLENIIAEERRLFYVAITRAEDHLILLTEESKPTPFLQGLGKYLTLLKWDSFPAINGNESVIVVKISNQKGFGTGPTYSLKELLKESGYKYQKPFWTKTYSSQNFTISILKNESWAIGANGILVEICDQSDACIKSYRLNLGVWSGA